MNVELYNESDWDFDNYDSCSFFNSDIESKDKERATVFVLSSLFRRGLNLTFLTENPSVFVVVTNKSKFTSAMNEQCRGRGARDGGICENYKLFSFVKYTGERHFTSLVLTSRVQVPIFPNMEPLFAQFKALALNTEACT
jgi:hypothetical protein